MDERKIKVFVAVADHLSFSRAARVLHLSQPAVSQQIAALEAELGARLFERTTRRVRLTAAGATLLVRAEPLLREYAETRRAVAASEGRIAGELSVAASLTIGSYVLPPALAELALSDPELRAKVTIENTEQAIGSLLSGRVDLGFVEGEVSADNIELHLLREDELVLIASRQHRFGTMEFVTLSDLLVEPFVLREEGSGTRQVAESYLRKAGRSSVTTRKCRAVRNCCHHLGCCRRTRSFNHFAERVTKCHSAPLGDLSADSRAPTHSSNGGGNHSRNDAPTRRH